MHWCEWPCQQSGCQQCGPSQGGNQNALWKGEEVGWDVQGKAGATNREEEKILRHVQLIVAAHAKRLTECGKNIVPNTVTILIADAFLHYLISRLTVHVLVVSLMYLFPSCY